MATNPTSKSVPSTVVGHLEKKAETALNLVDGLVRRSVPTLPAGSATGMALDQNAPAGMTKDAMKALMEGIGFTTDLSRLDSTDFKTLFEAVGYKLDGELIDDRTYFTEGIIQTCAKLPVDSMISKQYTDALLTKLWTDLMHPPLSYLGNEYKYRTADGSYNSLKHPNLGKANTPYARSVKPLTIQPVALPDPGVIFDSVMARTKANTEEHPNKISSMLFYLASIIIHDLFRTDHDGDFSNSKTSSYLDLAPLYGSNEAEQAAMRTHKDGKIHADCYSEKRLMGFPPGVGVLLMMFNRFHNHVVGQLALINEGGRFNVPVEGRQDERAPTWVKRDEDLFQTGRLITCGLYINCILLDYVRTILNLNKTNTDWALNPRLDIPGVETATGNQVSAEFNLVYRWHSAISARDERWTEEQYARLFPGKDPKTMDLPTFLEGLKAFEESIPNEPECRDYFHGQATRMKGHPYDDDFLVDILTGSIEDCANSFGAQRVPVILRAVEILGIQQGRAWKLATLNEFRKHFGLIPHKRFEDINPDEHVSEQLRRLYDSPDLVELYPGLVAEDAKVPLVPGAGLTPPFTVSRAVLSDAVALVRGDRFYTIDYHPKQLTNWGFSLVESDTAVDHGCVFYKLFLSAFPNHFEPNSVYAHYPLTIPKEMERVLTGLGKADQYTFTRPKRIAVPQVIFSYETAKKVLADNKTFLVPWGPAMHSLMGPLVDSFALAGDGPANQESRKKLSEALYIKNWEKQIKSYYIDKSTQILKARSYTLGGNVNRIDIIRDVGNRVPVHLAADLFNLHLKTADHPMGALTEDQLYVILLGIFTDIFLDLDPASSFPLRQRALQAVQALGEVTKLTVDEVDGFSGLLNELKSLFSPHTENSPLPDFGSRIIQRLLDSGREVHNFAWGYIISTISGLAPPQGQVFAQLLEYYLTDGKEHLDKMRDLALKDDDGSFKTLMHYVMEGARLGGETAVFRRVASDASIEDSGRTLNVKQGDKIMVNFRAAGRDPSVFPDPDKVKTDRPLETYIHQGYGPHQCIGLDIAKVCLTSLVKVVLKECPGLRPAPGRQGVVQKVATVLGPENVESKEMRFHRYLSETGDRYWPVPASMKVDWDK